MRTKNEQMKGITLISLVITIIILLILAGVTLNMVLNDGIIKQATVAKEKTEKATKEEMASLLLTEYKILVSNGEIDPKETSAENYIKTGLTDSGYDSSDVVITEDGNLYVGLTNLEISLMKNNLEIGDYVEYIPDGTIPEELPINLTRQVINWRVLKNDGKTVTLISETPIDDIQLTGIEDWLNGANKIDTTYAGLYSGSKGNARNLNEDDVNNIMGFDRDDETNWYFYDIKSNFCKVPVGVRTVGDLEKYATEKNLGTDIKGYTPDGKDIEEYIPNFYFYNSAIYKNETNSKQCNLIFGENRRDFERYWLTSTSVRANFEWNCVDYAFTYIYDGWVENQWLYDSTPDDNSVTSLGRPIVILNSNVEIDTEKSGDGSTVSTAWKLK